MSHLNKAYMRRSICLSICLALTASASWAGDTRPVPSTPVPGGVNATTHVNLPLVPKGPTKTFSLLHLVDGYDSMSALKPAFIEPSGSTGAIGMSGGIGSSLSLLIGKPDPSILYRIDCHFSADVDTTWALKSTAKLPPTTIADGEAKAQKGHLITEIAKGQVAGSEVRMDIALKSSVQSTVAAYSCSVTPMG